MADNNLGSSEEITDLNHGFEQMISDLSIDDKGLSIADRAKKVSAESLKKQTEAQNALIAAANNTMKDFYNFGKGLSTAGGSAGFESLNKIIGTTAKLMGGVASALPYVGEVLQGVIEGAAEVAKFMVGQFSKAYGNFEKLSDTGVISTFEQLRESSATIGLTFTDTEKVLSKYSTELANFGGTAIKGRQRFQELAFETKKIGESFQVIGISASDFADMQLSYISQQQKTLNGKNLTDKQLMDGSIKYIEELDTLSKLTGISRKELQEQTMERTRNARYLAGISGLDPKVKGNVDKLVSQFSALDSEFSEGMQDLIASGGAPTTDKAKAVFLALGQGGMDVGEEITRLRSGGDPLEFYNKSAVALKSYNESIKDVIKYVGADNIMGKAYIASSNIQIRTKAQQQKIEDDIAAKRKLEMENTGSEGKKLAETKRAMYNATKNIELLATGSKTMTKIMNNMSGGIESVVEKIYGLIGDKGIPEYLKLRKKERIAINEKDKIQKDLNSQLKRKAELDEEMIKIDKDPNTPKNKRRKIENEREIKRINQQITVYEAQLIEKDVTIKSISTERIKSEEAAGMRMTTGTSGSGTSAPGLAGTSGTNTSAANVPGFVPAGATSKATGSWKDDTEFLAEVNNYAKSMGFKAEDLLAVMASESGLDPTARNPKGTATGLIQFTEATAKSIGTSTSELSQMTRAQQMKYVAAFFKSVGLSTGATGGEMYAKVFLPARSKLDILTRRGEKEGYYESNSGLDIGNKGYISRDDLQQRVDRKKSEFGIASVPADMKQARTGGIFSGPSTGYFAILHGDEIVIPKNSGSSELQFNSMTDADDSENMVQGILLMMSKKVDKMINVTRNEISIQRKFALNGIK